MEKYVHVDVISARNMTPTNMANDKIWIFAANSIPYYKWKPTALNRIGASRDLQRYYLSIRT